MLGYGSKFYGQKHKEMKLLGYTKKEIKNNISFKFKTSVKIKSTDLSIKSVKEKSNNE